MRLHRFYVEGPIHSNRVIVDDINLLHQWRNVFRYVSGSQIVLFCGDDFDYYCVISSLTNREAKIEVVDKVKNPKSDEEVILYQSLIKKNNMEWVIEKATELGVSKVVPIISERSEKRGFNIERAKKIAKEASEQCGRANIPDIVDLKNLDEIFDSTEFSSKTVVFDKSGLNITSPLSFGEEVGGGVCVFVGPEGGWSENEIEKFKNLNIKIVSLGSLTLRAETASIAALVALKLLGL